MTNALVRARADLEAGRAWKARDRLTGLLVDRQDDETLELLIQVHLQMGDLPKAGALLFVLGREDEGGREAVAAWRQRFGDEYARWRSIPTPVRVARADQLATIRMGEKTRAPGDRDLPPPDAPDSASEVGWILGCLLLALILATMAVIGAVTVARAVF